LILLLKNPFGWFPAERNARTGRDSEARLCGLACSGKRSLGDGQRHLFGRESQRVSMSQIRLLYLVF